MNNTNQLISGDNKGVASLMLEKHMNEGQLPGKGPFVAAFASTNLGDVSPNTKGPHCLDTGLPCDLEHSTCNGRTQLCVAFGPGTYSNFAAKYSVTLSNVCHIKQRINKSMSIMCLQLIYKFPLQVRICLNPRISSQKDNSPRRMSC